ncbi:ParB/RepB/Spo0J family partition protein [Comamonas odontotermitis]|uniref:ParB/RepB/Spo0J family partition protein n=1 Tax=Comamonas odontotermitis TaxID=379895 RepID=UPI001CC6FDC3|nr:ParB/RepB/Spo0J family partition protein [Comamonas odontotermitis]UBB19524.1 ParB/RepB/Spo0J family partition protein [Comamonas odontotermitis]
MATNEFDTATQAMPLPGAGPLMRELQIDEIVTSRTNPRKSFDQGKLSELAASIKAMGVNVPIIVRPLPPERLQDTFDNRSKGMPLPAYEIVAGERRWRATKLAGLATIPAVIRYLDDAQALEVQIIENLQREDVSALEEAEGYEQLMQATGINADAVAAKIGMSRSYVFGRLKLLALCSEARDALREGDIDASRALLLARIPHHTLQIEALDDVRNGGYYSSAREAKELIHRQYMLYLRDARFDVADATLCPKAGACTKCPLNTANDRDLFADVKSADMCTDSKCFEAKEQAHNDRVLKAAHDQGYEVIEGKEAKALMPHSYSTRVEGYLRLDDKYDSPTDEPLRALIGQQMESAGIKPTMIANPHKEGELVAVLLPSQVSTLLAQAGHEEAVVAVEKDNQAEAKAAKEKEAAQEKVKYESTWRQDVAARIREELLQQPESTLPSGVVLLLAKREANSLNQEQAKQFCKLHELGKVGQSQAIFDWIDAHPEPVSALLNLLVFRDTEYRYWLDAKEQNKYLLTIAKEVGVVALTVQQSTKANMRAEKATKKQQEVKKAALSTLPDDSLKPQEAASTPPPAAQAQKGRGGKKGAKAQASETPKTSAEFARAQIAEAMQAAESPAGAAEGVGDGQEDISGAAAAAQDDDAQAVAVAQPATAPTRTAAWPFPPTKPLADTHAASGEQLTVGAWVTVNNTHSNKKLRGERGQVYSKVRDDYLINIPDRSPFSSTREHLTPCEPPAAAVAPADPDAFKEGVKVRIKADADIAPKYSRLRDQEGELRYSVGAKQNVWRVAFPGIIKRGLPEVQSFNIKDLEIVQ